MPPWLLELCAGLAATLALLAGCGKKEDPVAQTTKKVMAAGVAAPSVEEVKTIAEAGFVYGLPLVMNYAVQYAFTIDKNSGQFKAPPNTLFNERRVFTPADTAVVTPNSDTPYSIVWLDLRAEPMVISVPAAHPKRYYSVQLVDGNTFNYGFIGSRATGSKAGHYLIAGPRWQGDTPAGIDKVFRSGSDSSLALFRTQLLYPADMPSVIKVQDGYAAQPLSSFLKPPAPPAAAAIDWPKIDQEMVKTNFFEYLDFVLQFAPAGPEEEAIRAKLATIGVGPGRKLALKDLSAEHKAAILLGMKEGDRKVDERVANIGKTINGWKVSDAFGDRAFFNGDWLLRAAAARLGIYGNDAIEATYPATRHTGNGIPLDTRKDKYTITFAKNSLPPVNSFWSVTMYVGKTRLLIENPIDRYLVNSALLPTMKRNKDGSLTIYVQKDAPGKDRASNWLPAPNGPVFLLMRLYWPKTEPPSILPAGAGTWQPPALVAAD
ncbi:MAG: DUF1254 domain-containing protein [Betaproteobacteria bacterium]